MKKIPTQLENPNGLHQRYSILKIVPMTLQEQKEAARLAGDTYITTQTPKDKLIDTDPGSEYFVLRLDEGGKDREHIKACRIGVHAYADAIEHHLPELAKDLRVRYPLLTD